MNRAVLVSFSLLVAAGCSKPPAPAAPAPVPAPAASAPSAAADSAARAAARRDSLAALARADSLARAGRELARADSVRAEVERAAADSAAAARSGLAPADSAVLAAPIHFDYDKADLLAADLPTLDRKLAIFQAHPRLEIQVAGNCDERGSDEYNLALGERRAAAAKRYLVAHGVPADRIGVVSYGKERPLDPGHTEAAWARNRRDDFVVTRGVN
jgi:peptidoglycan-associated lipoprotein